MDTEVLADQQKFKFFRTLDAGERTAKSNDQ